MTISLQRQLDQAVIQQNEASRLEEQKQELLEEAMQFHMLERLKYML